MTLSNTPTRGKLMRNFTALGPYLREKKCQDNLFFFDCLAVCINTTLVPEKREFWGWWIELELENDQFSYIYQFGVSNREGCWQAEIIKQPEVQTKLETTLCKFHKRLHDLLITMELKLEPAKCFNEQPLTLLCHP